MINPRRSILRHTVINILKVKDNKQILKATREKRLVAYKGNSMRLSKHLSEETLQSRREY